MEGLRLFPAAAVIPKESERDSSLTVHTIPRKQGEVPVPLTVQLPKGTKIRIDVNAMQYSSKQSTTLCLLSIAMLTRLSSSSRLLGRRCGRVPSLALPRHGRLQVAARRVPGLQRGLARVHRQAGGRGGGDGVPRKDRGQVPDRAAGGEGAGVVAAGGGERGRQAGADLQGTFGVVCLSGEIGMLT